jgi:hypothetical protein
MSPRPFGPDVVLHGPIVEPIPAEAQCHAEISATWTRGTSYDPAAIGRISYDVLEHSHAHERMVANSSTSSLGQDSSTGRISTTG